MKKEKEKKKVKGGKEGGNCSVTPISSSLVYFEGIKGGEILKRGGEREEKEKKKQRKKGGGGKLLSATHLFDAFAFLFLTWNKRESEKEKKKKGMRGKRGNE